MTAERWRKIQHVFELATSTDPDTRDAVLALETAGDDDLRREVEKMLRHAFGTGPLDRPAWDGELDRVPRIGERLGPYELEAEAGAGGMGRVYKARDTRLGRIVAIKVLKAEFGNRFQAEARAISALNHPHVCALFDIGEQDGIAYLVMEYVEGESLAARLRRGPLPLEDVLIYGSQVASALEAAHRIGIVHRDLKPANIMITESGAKVLDFGVAQMAAGESGFDLGPEPALQPVMGTLAYMSPSQLNGNPTHARSDIFSLGLVLRDMACGPRALAGLASSAPIPAELAALIELCLREDSSSRAQSMEEVRLKLERMRSMPHPGHIRRIQAAWATALLVTLTVGGVLLWKASHQPAPPAMVAPSPSAMAPAIPTAAPIPLNQPTPAPIVQQTAYTPPVIPPEPPSLSSLPAYPGYLRDPSFSPDGRTLAFSWSTGKPGYGIYVRPVVSIDSPVSLTDGKVQDYGPAWSPDGRTISFRRGGDPSGIYLIPSSGGNAKLLSPIAKQAYETLPQMSWSRDGKWIAAPDRDPAGGTQLYLFSTATGEKRQLTTNPMGTDHAPAFSPDGKSLAYASCMKGVVQCDIFVLELGPGAVPKIQRRITSLSMYVRGVAWLPDGHGLVYSAGKGPSGLTYLWRVSVNPAGPPERIDVAGARARHPAASPSGGLLAFTDFNPGNWHLMLIQNIR